MNCGIFWTKAKETLGQSRKAKGWIGWKGWKPGLVNGYGSRKSPCFIGKMWEKYGKVIYNWAISGTTPLMIAKWIMVDNFNHC